MNIWHSAIDRIEFEFLINFNCAVNDSHCCMKNCMWWNEMAHTEYTQCTTKGKKFEWIFTCIMIETLIKISISV